MVKGDFKSGVNKLLNEITGKSVNYYNDNLLALVLYGSVAKDLYTPASDIDILIVLNDAPRGSYLRFSHFYEIEISLSCLKELHSQGINIEISPLILTKKELTPGLRVLWDENFIVLFDREGLFKNFTIELQRFKRENKIHFVKEPIPHFTVGIKNGK